MLNSFFRITPYLTNNTPQPELKSSLATAHTSERTQVSRKLYGDVVTHVCDQSQQDYYNINATVIKIIIFRQEIPV
jgi:hypothetical protein